MARTPFTLKSGNTPTANKTALGNFLRGFFGSAREGVSKLTGGVQKGIHKVAGDVSKVVKTDVPRQFAKDLSSTVSKLSDKNKELNKKRRSQKPTRKTKIGGNIFKK